MIAGLIEMIGQRAGEIAATRKNTDSINELSKGLLESAGDQWGNALRISEGIGRVDAGAHGFLDRSRLLSKSSSPRREMALFLGQNSSSVRSERPPESDE